MRNLPALSLLLSTYLLTSLSGAQSIAPSGTVCAGGHGTGTTAMLSWSVGQCAGASFAGSTRLITAGIQQPDPVWMLLNARVLLGGPYNTGTGLMNDGLRSASLVPATEPYTAAGFTQAGEGGGEQVAPAVLTTTGGNAIVDWVFVELRDAALPQHVFSTRCGLVQRDGDVVDPDGASPLRLSAVPGNYHVAIRHRNHLPAMTLNPIAFGTAPVALNFTDGSTATFGTEAQRLNGAVRHLWPGDVSVNQQVKYTGTGNDRDPILVAVGSTTPNNTLSGQYNAKDVNLDGSVKYTGSNNDRDPVLVTVGSTTPNTVRSAQLP